MSGFFCGYVYIKWGVRGYSFTCLHGVIQNRATENNSLKIMTESKQAQWLNQKASECSLTLSFQVKFISSYPSPEKPFVHRVITFLLRNLMQFTRLHASQGKLDYIAYRSIRHNRALITCIFVVYENT